MAVEITIYNVPEDLRDKLAKHASIRNQSIEDFLRGELEHIASVPAMTKQERIEHNRKIMKRARERLKNSDSRVTSEMIVESIRRGRGVYDD
ncbi:MAG: hypothetical protein OXC83_02785 [Chloroflexi bacterium]|nr:hypothetical protein [Chloroflexota bacterium]